MGKIWVKEFTGGLDTRRMPETTSGGVLVKGQDGHITSGGEFEKRASFVDTYTLPAGTVGEAATVASLYVFGHGATPGGMPAGVLYQRLQHPDGVTALSRIRSWDLYAGKLYVVGEFADGSIQHFYDGTRITDWFDGRARASFNVTGGSVAAAVASVGSFEVTGGTNNIANQITDLKIDGVSIIGSGITHTGNNATTAAAIASAINSTTSSPDYTASAVGQTVNVTAAATGPTPNGKAIVPTVTGNFTTGNHQNMAGGANAIAAAVSDLKVNGVSIISAPVLWTTSNEATATAIAAAINGYTSSPDYSATAVGTRVNIVATVAGAAANGRAVAFTLQDGMAVSPDTGLVLANGADNSGTFQPGDFVKTISKKVYSTSGPNLHFSGIQQPTKWTTDTVGAGFIDMSSESSGSETLTAIARYQTFAAVFAERAIQIWFLDPDPTLNRQVQVLNNTGTSSGNSVTQFGDNDLFYLDESGLRSLRARDSSNSAATSDIGVPIDTLVTAKLLTLSDAERQNVFGLIEPRDGRFWLIMKDTIFVFSFFNGAKVSAWTTYAPGFNVDAAVVFKKRVYLRTGNTIKCYGGIGSERQYDATVAEAWLPYLDANDPTRKKNWTGIDAALVGLWETGFAMDPTNEDAFDAVAVLSKTTYPNEKVPSIGESTHISPRFKTKGSGYAKLSAVVVHYEGDDDED